MGKAEVLSQLRSMLGTANSFEKKFWATPHDAFGFTCSVAKGIVVELAGNACHEWLLTLFKLNPEPLIFWCERASRIHPTAIRQRGVKLSRIKFLNSTEDLQQPLRMALESGHYPFIVAPNVFEQVPIFQKFHLLAEKSESTLFLISEKEMTPAWPISLQLEINAAPNDFSITVHRQRHGTSHGTGL